MKYIPLQQVFKFKYLAREHGSKGPFRPIPITARGSTRNIAKAHADDFVVARYEVQTAH